MEYYPGVNFICKGVQGPFVFDMYIYVVGNNNQDTKEKIRNHIEMKLFGGK